MKRLFYLSKVLIFAAVILGVNSKAHSQTSVIRTSSVIAGASPFQDSLWTINLTDNSIVRRLGPTVAGFTVTGINGLATDPITGDHYTILKEAAVPFRVLAKIDVQTGVATNIGNLGDNFTSLAFNSNGTLFGVTGDGATVPETMYRINTADASKTLFRALGNGQDGEVIAFCPDNNYFYHWSGNGTVIWERFDTTGVDVIQNLSFTGYTSGETFGALYMGNGNFLHSNISSTFRNWDTLGNVGSTIMSLPDDLRGLVQDTCISSISAGSSTALCTGGSVVLTVNNGAGNYQWYMDGALVSGETNATYTATAAGVYNVIYLDGCGLTDSASTGIVVTLNPTPDVDPISNQTVCNGAATAAVNFTGSVSGTTYTWNNTNSSIGLASTGTGDIMSFTATNATSAPTAGVITVTPEAAGCVGATQTFTVTVNPTPNVVTSSSQAVCNGAMTDSAYFIGSVAGTVFNWTNNNTSIGLAASGSGDILSFMATNTSFAVVTSTITVTPTANSCVGTPQILTITVNPTPDVMVPGNQSLCNNTATTAANFTSNVSGTTYTWVNDNSSIGLATTGTGNILSFTATNTTPAPIAGIVTVTPHANGCPGPVQSFTITVKPTPMLSSTLTPTEVCDSTLFHYPPASATLGTTFAWNRSLNADIWNTPASGVDTVDEYLKNTSALPVPVEYEYILNADGCTNTQMVTVVVNPTLLLTSTLTPPAVCDNSLFSYTPTSATPGTTFQWNRNLVTGIANPATTNSFNPLENLDNTTALPIVVTYNYNIIYHACSNTQDVTVTVNPTPMLSTTLTPAAVCDSTPFVYGPASATPGTTFSWSRSVTAGISNPAASGVDTIRDTLVNTFTYPVAVVYTVISSANGCNNVEYVTVTVNPRPKLTTTLTPAPVCSRSTFTYIPASATVGTTFAWSRAATTGISNPAARDTGRINEVLIDTTANPVVVIYYDTLKVNGCINVETISLTVNPLPRLSSSHTPAAICDSATFNYTPASKTVGSTFSWSRPYVLGIDLVAGTGTDNPNEQLINTTYFNATVVYVYTLTANGCTFSPDTVAVVVRPTPRLSSDVTVATCSNAPFTYVPQSYTPGTLFAWTRAGVNGIKPNTGSGTGNVNETLVDTANISINTVYKYVLTINGCMHTENVVVKVDPAPAAPIIAITSPSSVCSNTQYQNFGAAAAPAAGVNYIWSTVNANIMATGTNKQNALISFSNPGAAKVILSTNIGSTSCKTTDTFDVSVGNSISDNPTVTYYNGQFICLQNDVTTYQWGFDDALTLDSTIVPGEVNQVYFNSAPDLIYRYYWLITTHNGCMQKSYYNVPTGLTNVNTDISTIKVYPNPTSANVNVEINTTIAGDIQVEVSNLLGQKVNTAQAIDHKATINVSNLAAGCYLIDCYRDGIKIATSKFIKN